MTINLKFANGIPKEPGQKFVKCTVREDSNIIAVFQIPNLIIKQEVRLDVNFDNFPSPDEVREIAKAISLWRGATNEKS